MQRCLKEANAAKYKAESRELTAGTSSSKRYEHSQQILDKYVLVDARICQS